VLAGIGGGVLERMTGDPDWVLPPVDLTVAHPARMHNYWLGGGLNFAVDRDLAAKIMEIFPGIEDVARINQSFLRRAVLFMAESGIRQFLDIGSGLPNVGMVHEIVEQISNCHVVYVDPDPVAIAYSELLLENRDWAAGVQADVRDVAGVFDAEPARRLLDPEQPIGLLAPMLHFLPDRLRPGDVVAAYRDRLASGSHLVIAHATGDGDPPGLAEVTEAYRGSRFPAYPRTRAQILRLCHGFDLVEPGLVAVNEWRPQGPGDASANPHVNSLLYGAVGRKP
jgi:hypothetical protein